MIIVGLTGGIGYGKTTFAALLADNSRLSRHFETWELVAEVGSALRSESDRHPLPGDIEAINEWLLSLPDIVAQCVHADITFPAVRLTDEKVAAHPSHYAKLFEYLELIQRRPELSQVEITAENKELMRPLLQWLGGFLVITAGSGVWYDEILRRISHLQISGTDLVTVGGVRYPADAERLRNAGGLIVRIDRPTLPLQDAHDITERERDLIHPDAIIVNDGTLSDLAACARRVWSDLQRRSLTPEYLAADSSDRHRFDPALN